MWMPFMRCISLYQSTAQMQIKGKMFMFCAVLLILRNVVADDTVDCLPSIKDITCVCSNTSLSCNGTQDHYFGIVELISDNWPHGNLLSVDISIENLTLNQNFSFKNMMLDTLKIGSGLSDVNDTFFSGLGNFLHVLNLSYNSFVKVPSGALMILDNLHTLDLSYNDIKTISRNDFVSLTNLRILNLKHNAIRIVESGTFSNLSSLEVLDLSYNDVFLNAAFFDGLLGLNSLKYLSVSGNNFSSLGFENITVLPLLKTLYADENSVIDLANIHINSSSLQELSVRHCIIQGPLKADSLKSLPGLISADFSYNNITEVQSRALSALIQLKDINLSYNMIKVLDKNAFSALFNLIRLDLQHNNIQVVKDIAFYNLTKLRYLNLNNNKLKAFICEYTVDLLSLETIHIENNQIQIVSSGAFSNSGNLTELRLTGNELDCTCNIYDFSLYLLNQTSDWNKDITCSSPPSLQGESVREVDYSGMKCVSKSPCVSPQSDDYDYDDTSAESAATPTPISAFTSSPYASSVDVTPLSINPVDTAVTGNSENVTMDALGITNISDNKTSMSGSANFTADNVSVINATTSMGLELGVTSDASSISPDDITNSSAINFTPSKIPGFTKTDSPIVTDSLSSEHMSSSLSLSSSSEIKIASTASVFISDINDTTSKEINSTEVSTIEYNSSSPMASGVIHSLTTFSSGPSNFTSIPENVPGSPSSDSTASEPSLSQSSLSPTTYSTLIDIKNYTFINKQLCVNWSIHHTVVSDTKDCVLAYTYEKNKPEKTKVLKCPSPSDESVRECRRLREDKMIKFCIKLKNYSSNVFAVVCVPEHDIATTPEQPLISSDASSPKSHITESFPDVMQSNSTPHSTATEVILSTHSTFSPGPGNFTSPSTNDTVSPSSDSTVSESTETSLTTTHSALIDIKNYTLINEKLCIHWSIDRTIQSDTNVCNIFYTYEKSTFRVQQQVICPSTDGNISQCLTVENVTVMDEFCIELSNALGKFFHNVCEHKHGIDTAPEWLVTSTATSYLMTSNNTDSIDVSQKITMFTQVMIEPQTAFNITNFSILAEDSSINIEWSVNREESYTVCTLKLNVKSSNTVKEENFNCTDNSHVINAEKDGVIYEICLTSNHSTYGTVTICKYYDIPETPRVMMAAVTSSLDYSYVILICLFVLAICFLAVVAAKAILKSRHAADAYNVTKEESNVSFRKQSAHATVIQDHTFRYSYNANETI